MATYGANPALAGQPMANPMLGMLNGLALPFYSNNTITYMGPVAGLVLQFNNMSPQDRMNTKVLNISLLGNVVQESGICCMILTITAGSFCIFPLFLLCCDCYIKTISQLRDLPTDAYTAIDTIITQCPNIEKVIVSVFDNLLDANKASILERNLIRLPKLVTFDFHNMGAAVNVRDREYDNFEQYFPQTKQANRFLYNLIWGKKIIKLTNPPAQLSSSFSNPNMSLMGLGTNYPPPSFAYGKM